MYPGYFEAHVKAGAHPVAKPSPCATVQNEPCGHERAALDRGCQDERRRTAWLLEVNRVEVLAAIERWRLSKR